ncbi:MAG: PDZ domain-containing protein, partial [Burkholderiaceae bacterium]
VTGASDNAGIAEGDIILAVNQTDVTGVAQFNKLAAGLEKGRSAGVLVRRGDVTLWVAVQLTK